jgi:decaprenyl-phosphate phosphoribosyltransferase
LKQYFALLRVDNYIKNIFIILPLFFSGRLLEVPDLLNALYAMLAFSLGASSIYIVNDYFDRDNDKLHPTKKNRPLAARTITVRTASIIALIMVLISLYSMYVLSVDAFFVLVFYVLMNLAYSRYLKHVAVIDVSIISIGFVLRLLIGSFAANVELSHWIIIITFLLAFFIALAKRRDDVLIFLNSSQKMRQSIDGYNLKFIETAMQIAASVVIVSYLMYVSSVDVMTKVQSKNLYLTAIFVILGFFRYLSITMVNEESASPIKIFLGDRFLQVIMAGWLVSFGLILY